MNYLKLMTVAGSLLFLGYLCWDRLCGRLLTQGMKYRALLMVLLVYAVPWIWLRRVYDGIFALFPQGPETVNVTGPVNLADISADTAAYQTQDYRSQLLIAKVWMYGALAFLVVKICIYFYSRHKLLSAAEDCRNEIPEETIKRLKGEFHYGRELKICQVPKSITLTMGILKPVIFLQRDYEDEELDFILRHEMIHITRGDLLIKLLLEAVCCLHWFNPLIYILKGRFEFVCETSCDERVLMGCTKARRGAYAKLLVRSSTDHSRKIMLGSTFKNGYENVKERVNLIMTTKEVKRTGKLIAASSFALMLFANSLTALAYPEIQHVKDVTDETAEEAVVGDNFWGYDRYEEAVLEQDELEFPILYDEQFIDEEGNIYRAESASPQVICFKHNIVPGYFSTHIKNDDGSCATDVYESTKCLKCNTIWVGDLDHITIYPKCPH